MADVAGTPYISRTPFGGTGMETPMPYHERSDIDADRETKRRKLDLSSGLDVSRAKKSLTIALKFAVTLDTELSSIVYV